MAKDLVLLRYTDSKGEKLAALCRPREGVDTLKDIIGEETEADSQWFSQDHQSAVVIDTSGTVVVTSSEDLTMLSFWFAVAAQWLKTHGG
jgi:hypothetical protein